MALYFSLHPSAFIIESRVSVVDAVELGDLEAHHVARGLAHELLLMIGDGVLGDDIGRHLGVFLIGDGVHREKLDLLVVEAVVFAQRLDMLFGVAANHGLIDQSGSAIFRR